MKDTQIVSSPLQTEGSREGTGLKERTSRPKEATDCHVLVRTELVTAGYKARPAAAGPDAASCCSRVKVMTAPTFSLYVTSRSLTRR